MAMDTAAEKSATAAMDAAAEKSPVSHRGDGHGCWEIPNCEHLIRRMLVLDPSKRLTIAQIKEHKWMLLEVPVQRPVLYQQGALEDSESRMGEYNEQVLRLMHSLGIDQHKTIEVHTLTRASRYTHTDTSIKSLQNKSYNHFAAIYYLLVERLKSHRSSFPVDQRLDAQQRRPSTIAEPTVAKVSTVGPQVSLLPQSVRLLCSPVLPQALTFPQSSGPADISFMEDDVVGTPKVNGSLLEPLPPPVVRKGCPASPSNMMETSIDEGIETEGPECEEDPLLGPECEEDPLLVCTAFQSSRYGQRRHTLSEVSNQPGMAPSAGKLFAMSTDPSLGSMDSEYETGSVHSDLSLLEEPPGLSRMTPPFIGMRPPNPMMQALSAQKREAHNRSPVSFREGRRASDTSLTQGTVAFRQHLQNLARTKGILELNKVQMLYEQMGSSEDPALASTAPHLQDLLDRQQQGEPPQQQEDVSMFQNPIHPQLLSRRQSLETQYLTHRLQEASLLAQAQNSCQMYCKESPRSLEQQLQEHRLHQKRLFLQKQSQLQAYFNQMQIAEGSYAPPDQPPRAPVQLAQQSPQRQAQAQQVPGQYLSPVLEPPGEQQLQYDPYLGQYPVQTPSHLYHLPPQQEALNYSYQPCELGPNPSPSPEHYQYPAHPAGNSPLAVPELHGSLFDCEMMETVDPQNGFVLVN
ncbi:UNVERIFIED_CONTAM: hypothetical protein FKN15_027047 [Acipenser sinensis]